MPAFRVSYECVEYHTEWFMDIDGDEYEEAVAEYTADYAIVDAADDDQARAIVYDEYDAVSVLAVTLEEDE